MILTTVHLYILSFFLFLFFDYLIRKNVFGHYFYSLYNSAFGNMKYGFLVFTLVFYIFSFILIYTLQVFDLLIIVTPENNLFSFMTSDNDGIGESNSTENKGINVDNSNGTNTAKTSISDSSFTVTNPNFNISIDSKPFWEATSAALTAAISATGGAAAALRMGKILPGSPSVKLLAAAGTMIGVQATTLGMKTILNKDDAEGSNNSSQFIQDQLLTSNSLNTANNNMDLEKIQTLLSSIQMLNITEFISILCIININIVNYIITKDYGKYIPNNKLGQYINMFLNRYIKLYSKSNKFLLGLCVFNLFIGIVFSKFCLYQILNP